MDGVALQTGFTCNTSDININMTCSEDNPILQDEFDDVVIITMGLQNRTIYDPDDERSPWEDGFEPTCRTGIPGITRTKTIVGK